MFTYCVGTNVYFYGNYVLMSLLDDALRQESALMSAVLGEDLSVFQCEECFNVMWSVLWQSQARQNDLLGVLLFSFLWSTLCVVSWSRWIGCK